MGQPVNTWRILRFGSLPPDLAFGQRFADCAAMNGYKRERIAVFVHLMDSLGVICPLFPFTG